MFQAPAHERISCEHGDHEMVDAPGDMLHHRDHADAGHPMKCNHAITPGNCDRGAQLDDPVAWSQRVSENRQAEITGEFDRQGLPRVVDRVDEIAAHGSINRNADSVKKHLHRPSPSCTNGPGRNRKFPDRSPDVATRRDPMHETTLPIARRNRRMPVSAGNSESFTAIVNGFPLCAVSHLRQQ